LARRRPPGEVPAVEERGEAVLVLGQHAGQQGEGSHEQEESHGMALENEKAHPPRWVGRAAIGIVSSPGRRTRSAAAGRSGLRSRCRGGGGGREPPPPRGLRASPGRTAGTQQPGPTCRAPPRAPHPPRRAPPSSTPPSAYGRASCRRSSSPARPAG